jgi:hypothetical protein
MPTEPLPVPITATYPDRCHGTCSGTILPGDRIIRRDNGWRHTECDPASRILWLTNDGPDTWAITDRD